MVAPRRSQRVVETPSQPEVDANADVEDDEEVESDNSDMEEDYAEPAAVKVATGARKAGAARAQNKPQPRPRAPAAVKPDVLPLDSDDLVGVVEQSTAAFVKELVELYGADPDLVITKIINVVAQYAGADHSVAWTEEDVLDGVEEAAKDLEAHLKLTGGVDHFKDKGKTGQGSAAGIKAKKKLTTFFSQLVRAAHDADHDVLEMLRLPGDFCTLVSASAYQVSRIAAVAAATHMMSAFVDLAMLAEQKRDRATRQLETAKDKDAKGKSKDATARVKALKASVEAAHRSGVAFKDKVGAMWEAIMAERFRDRLPSVRVDVVRAIAYWARTCPLAYLNERYLKYISWAMSDRVRLPALFL